MICITSLIGIFAVSASLQGFFLHRMKWHERILSAAGGLLLIDPGLLTDAIGLGIIVAVVVFQLLTHKNFRVSEVNS